MKFFSFCMCFSVLTQCFAQAPIKYFVKNLPDSVFFTTSPFVVNNDRYICFYCSNTFKGARTNLLAYNNKDASLLYNKEFFNDTTVENGGYPFQTENGFMIIGKLEKKPIAGQKRKFEFQVMNIDFNGNIKWERRYGSNDTINQYKNTYNDIFLSRSFVTNKYTEVLWSYVPTQQEGIYMRFENATGKLIDSFGINSPKLNPIDPSIPNIRFYYYNSKGEISIFQQIKHDSTAVYVLNNKTRTVEYKATIHLINYYQSFGENGFFYNTNGKIYGLSSEANSDVMYIYSGRDDGLWNNGGNDSITLVEMNTYRVFRQVALNNYRRNNGCPYQDNIGMKVLSDGSIILTGTCYDFMSTVPFVAKYDMHGNKLWYDVLTGADVTTPTNVEIDSDGGILFIAKNNNKSYLIKYNPYGQLLDWIDSSQYIQGEIVDRYYPNPFTDFITLLFKQNFSGVIKVFDLFGRQVLYDSFDTTGYYNLFLPNNPLGHYIVQIEDTDKKIRQTFKITKK